MSRERCPNTSEKYTESVRERNMCQFEAPKQEGKSDEARVRMRQEAQEAGAGNFCKRKSNGRGEGSG